MFPLHEKTQRRICRTAFLALCVAPTLLLLAYALRLQLPGYRAAVASELGQAVGVVVSLDDLLHPRQGQTRLSNVRLCDPETGAEIASIRELEIADTDDRIVIHAAQPKLDARHFHFIFERFEDRLLRSGAAARRIELHAADLTITSPDTEAQTLRNVLLTVSREKDTTAAELRYLVAGVAMHEAASLRLTRTTPKHRPATTQLAWHTGGASLPVAPWVTRFPWLANAGKNCHFRGELQASQTPAGWRGEVGGEFNRIDLDLLVSEQFPHKLSGEARAIVESLRFDDGRVTSARGRFEAGPGVIGQSLVTAAMEQFSLRSNGAAATEDKADALRRYNRLALHFALDENQLTLRGECVAAPEGTALVIGEQRYATAIDKVVSPLALVRTLSPSSEHQVPATAATRSLVRVLPLPKETSQAETTTPRGHVRGEE